MFQDVSAISGRDVSVPDGFSERYLHDLELGSSNVTEINSAIAAAVTAFRSWRQTPASGRAACLRSAADRIRNDAGELGDLLCATTGRLIGQAKESAVVAADLLDEAAVTGVLDGGRSLNGASLAVDSVRREPRGVIAVVTPWNDPYPAAAGLLAAALVTGNTVVHKPSERSSAPGIELARRIAESLPDGVLNIVAGGPEAGAAIVSDDRVQVVAHIGSSATGRRIAAAAGARGGRVLLENGGKDPIIVDAGVDPVWAAQQIATGAFTNTGQLCTAVERVYLHEAIANDVTAELVRIAESLAMGDPSDSRTQLGPLVDEEQLRIVSDQVSGALRDGAACVSGGLEHVSELFFPATVLTGCTPDMTVMREETFGPVAPIAVVSSFEQALEQANATMYGLAATVLTGDVRHALLAASELDVGTVKVNSVFGGAPGGSADPRKGSGSGPGFGPDLLHEFTALKAVHLEGLPE